MAQRWSRHVWWILTFASLVTLGLWLRPAAGFVPQWEIILIAASFIAFLASFPIPVGEAQINLAHTLSLTIGVALGPGAAGLALLVGLSLGEVIRTLWNRRRAEFKLDKLHAIRSWALTLSRQVLSLSGGVAVYLLLGGRPLIETRSLPAPLPSLGLGLTFGLLFFALHWLDHLIFDSPRALLREIVTPLLVSLAPIPFGLLSAASYVFLGIPALLIYGSMAATVSPIVRNLVIAGRNLQRRLQELSTISHISQAMRTSLDLDALLTTIYLQVAHLLQVKNFYIAFHDSEDNLLSYPLAVKHGIRQAWPDRPFTDRLTDRVIQRASPILIPRDAPEALNNMGLPELENAPQAWIGVPLLNPERAIGCLAVFHTEPGKVFTSRDLDVLSTLAGQAAVAIENALLYEQTHNRATALASLNEITTSMSSTLDPERAIELVCLSMIRVGGGDKSAIYLYERDLGELFLAHGTHLSDEFMHAWMTIPIEEQERIQAFHNESPVLVAEMSTSHLSQPIITQMQKEGIQAFADFPLITPSGTIGQVSVYFSEPQRFQIDQIELLKTFAAQAALAVANARAHAATDLALQRRVEQLATLEAIGREMNATLDIADLFKAILKHALRVTNAAIGHLAIYESEVHALRIVAHHAYPTDSPIKDPSKTLPLDQGIPARVFQTGEICNAKDVHLEHGHLDWTNGLTRSLLSVPILRQENVLGVITVENPTISAFTEEHEHFLAQLAAQAAVALANATLYQQLEARLREQSLLYQASTQIASSFESKAVALAIADSLSVAISSDGARVLRWNTEDQTLVVQASVKNGQPKKDTTRSFAVSENPALETCLRQGQPQQWTLQDAPSEPDQTYLSTFHQAGSILVVPIIVGDQTLGLIEAFNEHERLFDENAIRTAQTIASQAAIALENTELFRRISESHNRLTAVLNSTREGMLLVDPLGKIVLANDQIETLTGLTVDQIVGRNLSEEGLEFTESIGYRPGELANFISDLRSGQVLLGKTFTYDSPRPPRRTFQRSDAPVRDARGQLIGWLIVLRDITEERELDETREQLTEMIVHDLRSPLTAILGSLKLLDDTNNGDSSSPIVSQALSVSKRSVQQMLDLVNSLLDIAKLESGELELSLQPVCLKELCQQTVNLYVHEANEFGIILDCSTSAKLSKINADEEKLRRVIGNLLDNALKFTPAGGRVDVRAEGTDDGVLIHVVDTGPGVPSEFRDRIFERFGQVPGLPGRRRGTGLGLAFSRLAVNAHGGRIWVEDSPEGGNIISIFLPNS